MITTVNLSPYKFFSCDENFEDLHSWQFSNVQCSVVTCDHYAVHYVPGLFLFYDWKFVSFDSLNCFTHAPTSSPLTITNLFSVSMTVVSFGLFAFQISHVSEIM